MKKLLFLIIATIIAGIAPVAAQTPQATQGISTSEAITSVYNPSTKTNHKGQPLIIMTTVKKCLPTARARRLLPPYIETHNPGVDFIQVNIEETDSSDWIDKMDIAATGKKQKEYASPIFYFVNTNGSVKRFTGFAASYLTDTRDRCIEFQNLISNLR